MVGREINLDVVKSECKPGEIVLKLENASTSPQEGSSGIHNFSLEVHRGEIVGLAGVDGNGQTDLSELIMGLRKLTGGSIQFLGQETAVNRRRISDSCPSDTFRQTGCMQQ